MAKSKRNEVSATQNIYIIRSNGTWIKFRKQQHSTFIFFCIWNNRTEQNKYKHCHKTFSSEVNLKNHLKIQHNTTKPCFRCSECPQTTTTPYNLIIHYKDIHETALSLDAAKKQNEPIKVTAKCKYIVGIKISVSFIWFRSHHFFSERSNFEIKEFKFGGTANR